MTSAADTKQVALITGGTRGIGRAVAETLAAQGYALLLGYNSDGTAAEEAKRELENDHKVKVEVQAGDVADAATCAAFFHIIRNKFSSCLTAVVHNAGTLLVALGVPYITPSEDCVHCLRRAKHQCDVPITARGRCSPWWQRRYLQLLPGCVHSVFQAFGGRCPPVPWTAQCHCSVLARLQHDDAGLSQVRYVNRHAVYSVG